MIHWVRHAKGRHKPGKCLKLNLPSIPENSEMEFCEKFSWVRWFSDRIMPHQYSDAQLKDDLTITKLCIGFMVFGYMF